MIHNIIWQYWKKFGKALGKIQTTIILSVIYYLIITPTGLIKKYFQQHKKTKTYWLDLPEQKPSLEESFKQY